MARHTKPQVNSSAALVPMVGRGGYASHLIGKALPYASPWIAAAALPPIAGAATNAMWGDGTLSVGLASAGLGIGTAVLSAVTWTAAGDNNRFRKYRRAQATASVAAGMGWLTAATAAGPFGHPMVDLWLMGGGLFAASWNIRQVMRNAHDETEQAEQGKSGLAKIAEAIGLEKLRVKEAKGTGKGVVKAPIEVEAGKTIADVQAAMPKLTAALQVPGSGATVTTDPDNNGQGVMSIRVADLLKDGVEFVPPARLGLLPTDPIPVGLYADGEVWIINPFDAAILQHLLVMGVTGAGKSEFARAVLAHLMTRRKLSVMLVDCAKGRQTVGHIKQGLDVFATTPKEAKRLVKSLPAAIKARGDRLADEGLDQWTPQSSLNAVVVWMEEAADLVDFEELSKIARAARSVGIWLVISLQRATWTNMSVDVRTNLQSAVCFGVDDAGDAGFALPDQVVAAGAVPDWGAHRPGYAFATGMGIPQERWTTEVRASLTNRDYLAALVDAAAPYRDPLDDVTANAFGAWYAQREHKGTNRTNMQAAQVENNDVAAAYVLGAALEEAGVDPTTLPGADADEDEEAMAVEIQDVYDEVMGAIPADPEPGADYANVQLDDDGPEVDEDSGIEFQQQEKATPEEARELLYQELDAWLRNGRLEFAPADLIPVTVAAGRGRPWLQGQLKRLTEDGFVQRDGHGDYTIVQSPLVPA